MDVCLLPHAFWNPVRPSSMRSLAALYDVATTGDALTLPLRWRDGRHVFAATAYDLLEQDAAFVHEVFGVMVQTPRHEFQIETARSDRLLELSRELDWRPNIWMGVAVESAADLARIDDLRRSGARVRFAHIVGAVAVGRRDCAGLEFVMADAAVAEQYTLERACETTGCRLFVGGPEAATERALPRSEGAPVLWAPGRERR